MPLAKAAILDLGTNTFHLLLVSYGKAGFSILHREKRYVKLARGSARYIHPEAMQRALFSLQHFHEIISGYRIRKVIPVATQGFRQSSNAEELADTIYQRFQWKVRVVSGAEEAELILDGIRQALPPGKEPLLVLDIGGASVECIAVEEDAVLFRKSFPAGAANLLSRFGPAEGLTPDSRSELRHYLDETFAPLWLAVSNKSIRLVGSSGTFDSLVDMLHYPRKKEAVYAQKPYCSLDAAAIHELGRKLSACSEAERKHFPGLEPERVEMIPYAMEILGSVMEHLNIQSVTASDYALKEGVAWRLSQGIAI